MKILISLKSPEFHNLVIQALSGAQLLDKVDLETYNDDFQQTREGVSGLTSVRTYNCQTERLADNTLVCKACARPILLTPQGEVDSQKYALEMKAHL